MRNAAAHLVRCSLISDCHERLYKRWLKSSCSMISRVADCSWSWSSSAQLVLPSVFWLKSSSACLRSGSRIFVLALLVASPWLAWLYLSSVARSCRKAYSMCSLGLDEVARQPGRLLSSEATSSKCESSLVHFAMRIAKRAQKVIAFAPCTAPNVGRSERAGSEKFTVGSSATTALSRTSERGSLNSCFETACASGRGD